MYFNIRHVLKYKIYPERTLGKRSAGGKPMSESVRPVEIFRVGREPAAATDVAATEEPLEMRLDGHTFVVTMRTPGADPDLDVPLPGTAGPGLTGTGTTGTGDLANDPDAGGEERP